MQQTLITQGEMQEVLETVFSSMLSLPLRQVERATSVAGMSRLSASVHISGDWNGVVLLHVTERFARHVAA